MPITIRDLASYTHLSITTVSRALDGYGDVSQLTRERVINAAREIGYQPSAAARQLRRQKSDSIGYILPTPSPQFTDPFYSSFLEGLCDATGSTRYDMLISSAAPASEAEKILYQRWVESRKVDGFVLNRIRNEDWRVQFLQEHQIPFVAMGSTPGASPFPHISLDLQTCYGRLTHHLIENGHERIAFIGANPELTLQHARLSGYLSAMEKAFGKVNHEFLISGNLSRESGYSYGMMLLALPTPPTAIVCCDDLTAMGVYRAVQQHGLVVGKDVAVTGDGGIPESETADPPLTTIILPAYKIAHTLARMLFSIIEKAPIAEQPGDEELEIIFRASSNFRLPARGSSFG